MAKQIRVTVWNEFRHEKTHEAVAKMYPEGIHGQISKLLGANADMTVRTATLDEPDNGLPEAVLAETDVLTWWGHMAHGDVADETVDRVQARILEGMGLVVLHSGHFSKIFKRMMGTTCNLRWREIGEKERVWVVDSSHPITQGLDSYFEVPHTEMYGERFDIPQPDELVFISWYEGGEVFRSGCCFHRGNGKIFYFSPGHETLPIYYQDEVQKVITNGVRWAAPSGGPQPTFGNVKPIENVTPQE